MESLLQKEYHRHYAIAGVASVVLGEVEPYGGMEWSASAMSMMSLSIWHDSDSVVLLNRFDVGCPLVYAVQLTLKIDIEGMGVFTYGSGDDYQFYIYCSNLLSI